MMDDISLEFIDSESNPDGESNAGGGSNAEDESNVQDGSNTESGCNVEDGSQSKGGSIEEEGSKTIAGSNAEDGSEESTNRRPPWWRMISTFEGVLAGVLICTIIVLFVLAVTCYLRNPQVAENLRRKTCVTPGCVHTASRILADMDPEVEPCDNFYRFACGNFIRNNHIPDGKNGIDRWSEIKDNIIPNIRITLEEPIKPDEPKPFVLVKNLYKACMNTSLNESLEIQPFSKTLESLGGWPVLKGAEWDEAGFDWKKSLVEFRKKGFKYNQFFKVSIAPLYTNPDNYAIKLSELTKEDFGIFRNHFLGGMQNRIVNTYYKYMVDTAVYLGAPREIAEVEMKESLLFEINLANFSSDTIYVSQLPDIYTIAELQIKYPIVDWIEYLNALLPTGITFNDDEEVCVEANNHIKDTVELLKKTPKRVIANYLMWKFTSENIELLMEDFRKRDLEYKALIHDIKPREILRVEYCTGLIWNELYNILYSLYASKYFNADAKSTVVDMVHRLKIEVAKILKDADWMDEKSRVQILRIAHDMIPYIGYPNKVLDIDELEEYYRGLEIDEYQFRQSLLNIKVFLRDKFLSELKKPTNKSTDWMIQKDFTKNKPYYKSDDNSINFPVGIFQGVFFSPDRPQYMNYGAIGHVLGHEITHGLCDLNTATRMVFFNTDFKFWSGDTQTAYFKKAQCFKEQYANYTVEEVYLNINGRNTQVENVADNGAIKEAYLAYTKWVKDYGEEPQLPGLKYTPKQMFWLSFGSMWCSKYTQEWMKKYVKENKHSPKEFRVLGTLRNSKHFAKDFKCPPGSPMNPLHKCKLF